MRAGYAEAGAGELAAAKTTIWPFTEPWPAVVAADVQLATARPSGADLLLAPYRPFMTAA